MSKQANPATIGAFVLAGLVMAASALAILGSGKLFKESQQFVLYFDSSLSGLDVGAPVECRGVRIGTVTRITLDYDTANGNLSTPVYIQLEADRIHFTQDKRGRGMDYHIAQGMRAQLQSQSLITGKLKIMLVNEPGTPLRLVGGDPRTPEIPTIPMLSETIANTIEELPLPEIIRNLNRTMESVAHYTSSGDMTNAIARLASILQQMDQLASGLNRHLPQVLSSAQQNADQFLSVQQEAGAVIREIKDILARNSAERQQINTTLRSMEDAALALRDFLAYLQLHPESLITGKKEY